jgi:nucleotide-binding universal stress UspA family protein
MYHTILVAVALQHWEQYSAHALAIREVALAIARGASHPLHILSIYAYDSIDALGLAPDVAVRHQEDMMHRTDELMGRKMDEYIVLFKEEGIGVVPMLRVGNPRVDILQTATRLKADLLLIGSHSKRGLFDAVLGGTAQHVSRNAPCPVVLVSPKR